MTLNKKTIKSVCGHESEQTQMGSQVLGLQVPSEKAIAALLCALESCKAPA